MFYNWYTLAGTSSEIIYIWTFSQPSFPMRAILIACMKKRVSFIVASWNYLSSGLFWWSAEGWGPWIIKNRPGTLRHVVEAFFFLHTEVDK